MFQLLSKEQKNLQAVVKKFLTIIFLDQNKKVLDNVSGWGPYPLPTPLPPESQSYIEQGWHGVC